VERRTGTRSVISLPSPFTVTSRIDLDRVVVNDSVNHVVRELLPEVTTTNSIR